MKNYSENKKSIVYNGDCFDLFEKIDANSVDAVITDPPYFLDGMGDSWDEKMIGRKTTKNQTVSSLRSGMKFDKKQGLEFQNFMNKVAEESMRILKPGGWFVSFSAPRLYHRLGVGVEDAGFEIRDMWEWLYTQNQMKAMSVVRSMMKDNTLDEDTRQKLEKELSEWKTPQVKSCFEPILMAQKPREGTFYENWKNYHIGLVNILNKSGENEKITSNVITTEHLVDVLDKTFLVGKPTKKEKGETTHLSVKPLSLMEHLSNVLVPNDGIVLDPFNGSGSTGIAAMNGNKKYVGFEKDRNYFEQSFKRFEKKYHVVMNDNNFVIGDPKKDSGNLFEIF